MKIAVITGASKGLGSSIAKKMISNKISIVSVARTENEDIKSLAEENNLFYKHVECNLSQIDQVEKIFGTVAADSIFSQSPEEVYLINNAGIVEPIETVGKLDSDSVQKNVQINLVAPIIISNLFLEKAGEAKLTIVNVTSGAAERPIQGWSTYCTTKAGLNMFTKTAALEQQTNGSKHVLIGYSPGIMDTEMQGTIRSSSKESFNDIEKFKEYKEKGLLRHPDVVGNALVELLLSTNVESGRIYNVNDLV